MPPSGPILLNQEFNVGRNKPVLNEVEGGRIATVSGIRPDRLPETPAGAGLFRPTTNRLFRQ